MKKLVNGIVSLTLLTFISTIIILSTTGIKTNKFNKLISSKVFQSKNFNLQLDLVKFKIDLKKLSLFLETQDPTIIYRNINIPVVNIKVYIDFLSLIKSEAKINKISLKLKELDIIQVNELSSTIIKPSNFKSLLNNKIKEGKLITEIEIFFTDKGLYKDFIAKGKVKNLKIELFEDLSFSNTNFSFFSDKDDILIQNIFGNIDKTKIFDGDIILNLDNGINLTSNFNSEVNLNEKFLNKYSKFLEKYISNSKISNLKANLQNSISIDLDETYKVKNYNYGISGNLEKTKIELYKPFKNDLLIKEINSIYLSDLNIKTNIDSKDIYINGEGKYSLDGLNFYKMNIENNFKKNLTSLKLNLDYANSFRLGLINFEKSKDSIANLYLDLENNKNYILINKFSFTDENNLIEINGLAFKEKKFLKFENIKVTTKNNDFYIKNGKKILVKGSKFDATNLPKFLKNQNNRNFLEELNSNLEIDFKNVKVPMSEKIENFKLIGEVEKGQLVKISSKGDFGGDNFLDITMKKDKNSKKKYLEIYSDLTRPLLAEYSFFNGLAGGKLLFTSIIDESKSNSKLKIENFKVINAPGVIKLLSLADLGGLADLVEGEGLSFDVLEINFDKNKDYLKLNEILALGPSMSVLMEGYQNKELTSLRGTLVPAKTLNKMISKIPVIGNIVIPKEVGEGLFGISFKMKGPKGKIKTTINPIRTLTPRFIQKIIEREKDTK